ncbi:MAG: hypothetical protein PHY12_03335 [Eubacteriales bacterium]|nr:hypothetical protein [Eubacteriales bacterium]
MKKLLCLLTAAVLLACSAAFAEEEPLYPEGYNLLLVTDVFPSGDDELYEEKTEEELSNAPERTLLQGTFGALSAAPATDAAQESELAPEADPAAASELIGFDKSDIHTFWVAENCVILLPKDPLDPTEIVQIDDLQAWYDHANEVMADYFDEGQGSYEFYATFEMNDEGDLTKLEYQYFDWQ